MCLPAGMTPVKVAQLCPTLCDHMDYTVHGILQARILEWVTFAFSRGSSQPSDQVIKISHHIKHNSQLLDCEYFLSPHVLPLKGNLHNSCSKFPRVDILTAPNITDVGGEGHHLEASGRS